MRTTHFPRRSSRARHEGALLAAAAGGAFVVLSAAATPASAQPLVYYGGGVISNVKVVQVAWTAEVAATRQADLTKFYEAVLGSTYLDWLSEYDTIGKVGFADGLPGSEQHIGRGSFAGAFVITPNNTATLLDDGAIAKELVDQIGSGALPKPELDAQGRVRSLYMFDFPPGYDFTVGPSVGCGDFDGYHSTVLLDDAAVPFGVHPDCGHSFGALTAVHAHELVEAITDPDTGLAAGLERPMAWRATWENGNAEEISDLCQAAGVGIVGGFKVAKNWSNYAGGCVVAIPVCDGELAPPACRPCSAYDNGFACSGETPLCAEDGAKEGQCVACTAADASACAGATPLCDVGANACVGCLGDADCTDAGAPVCDAETRACRGCSANEECQSGVCDTAADGAAGQCVECDADTDCGADQVCTEHACVAPPATTTTGEGGDTGTDAGGGCAVGRGAGEESGGKEGETSRAGAWIFVALAAAWGRLRRSAWPRRPWARGRQWPPCSRG